MSNAEHSSEKKSKVVKKRSTTRQRAEANPEKILDVTMGLMAEFGYAGTSMSMIRERSGYPTTSIYWHFGSKEKLLLAALEHSALQVIDSNLARRSARTNDADLIESQARSDAEFLEKPPAFMRLIFLIGLERRSSDPEVTSVIARIRKHSRDILAEQILHVIRPAGQILPRDLAEELSQVWMAFGDGIFVASQLDPGSVDVVNCCRQQLCAMQALAEKRLEERKPLGG
ncbi:TetR/AcrR family transcriptional regulator [Pseudomonas capeferrum]|uniref:TetR/AcrR family transcriptional regulator n=1 Tax=Pseudomonas capeferrum TaxID=1495066 RepID=UPI0015E331B2|nr:TetR/AcrR family transcriptional regulator [Pseudomonas capeferrum]MBA1203829.1 TetR/AcrR family transcriptional regulator [Pseudomonas capeferrum]